MNRKQADAEARRRWGKDAIIRENPKALPYAERMTLPKGDNRRHAWRCDVGRVYRLPMLGAGFKIEGSGDTWDQAFANADKTAERYASARPLPAAPPSAGETT